MWEENSQHVYDDSGFIRQGWLLKTSLDGYHDFGRKFKTKPIEYIKC